MKAADGAASDPRDFPDATPRSPLAVASPVPSRLLSANTNGRPTSSSRQALRSPKVRLTFAETDDDVALADLTRILTRIIKLHAPG